METLRFFATAPGSAPGPVALWSQGLRPLATRPGLEVLLARSGWTSLSLTPDAEAEAADDDTPGLALLTARADPIAGLESLRDEADALILRLSPEGLARLTDQPWRPSKGRIRDDWGTLDWTSLDFRREAMRLTLVQELLALTGGLAADPPLFVRLDRGPMDRATALAETAIAMALPAPPEEPPPLTLVVPAAARGPGLPEGSVLARAAGRQRPVSPADSTLARMALASLAEPEEREAALPALLAFLRLEESLNRIDHWPDPLRRTGSALERAYAWHRQQGFVQAAAALICWSEGYPQAAAFAAIGRLRLASRLGPALADRNPPEDQPGRFLPAIIATWSVLDRVQHEALTREPEAWETLSLADLLAEAAVIAEESSLSPQGFIDTARFLAEGNGFRDELMAEQVEDPLCAERLRAVDALQARILALVGS